MSSTTRRTTSEAVFQMMQTPAVRMYSEHSGLDLKTLNNYVWLLCFGWSFLTSVSSAHPCAASIKSQRATQVWLIFHQDYSWINAFRVLLKFMFNSDEKTACHVDRDVTARPHVRRTRRFITERFPVISNMTHVQTGWPEQGRSKEE